MTNHRVELRKYKAMKSLQRGRTKVFLFEYSTNRFSIVIIFFSLDYHHFDLKDEWRETRMHVMR